MGSINSKLVENMSSYFNLGIDETTFVVQSTHVNAIARCIKCHILSSHYIHLFTALFVGRGNTSLMILTGAPVHFMTFVTGRFLLGSGWWKSQSTHQRNVSLQTCPNHGTCRELGYKPFVSLTHLYSGDVKKQVFSAFWCVLSHLNRKSCCLGNPFSATRDAMWFVNGNSIILGRSVSARGTAKKARQIGSFDCLQSIARQHGHGKSYRLNNFF